MMDNHAHIMLQSNNIEDIAIWMRRTNTSYAIYYNKINDRIGYVFRERYKVQPIKSKKHLYLGIEYIHNNPVKARICEKKEEYEFSSYGRLYQANQIEMQKEISEILKKAMLQVGSDDKEQKEKFEFLEDEKENKEIICEKVVNHFLQKRGYSIEELKKEKQDLIEIIKILKYENKVSYRLMEKYLNISRETLRKLI